MKMKVIGIYLIEDILTGNAYAGQSKDIAKRWSCHVSHLKAGNHKYKELQEAYIDNPKRIKFTILEECKEEELTEREQYYMEYVNKVDGWTLINKQKHGGVVKRVKDTSKMKAAQVGSRNGNARLSEADVIEIKKMLIGGVKRKDIATKYNVSNTLINNIANGNRWSSVEI
ncbi:GIY-YIG nuclease family protein [Clostridium neonatale]|uniref:GIY-YIG nuclease family protein n=1 Tax=Clostridium neonatale TaxID=137838 RepID=UPI003D3264BD